MIGESTQRNRRSGFTLIEILVVVAIIALLIAILLPSLRSAREQGRAVVCETHLNQIAKGIFLYTRDNNDVLPHIGWRESVSLINYLWFTQVNRYLSNQLETYTCPSDQRPVPRRVRYNRSRRLKMADGPSLEGDSDPFYIDVSYQGSCDLLDPDLVWTFGKTRLANMPRKITVFKRPSFTITLTEGQEADSTDRCIRYEDLNESVNSSNADIRRTWRRHNGRSHFLFMDTHVDRVLPEKAVLEMTRNLEYIEERLP